MKWTLAGRAHDANAQRAGPSPAPRKRRRFCYARRHALSEVVRAGRKAAHVRGLQEDHLDRHARAATTSRIDGVGLADYHAQIIFDGRDFNLSEVDTRGEILINGKKKRRASWSTATASRSATVELTFSLYDEAVADRRSEDDARRPSSPGCASSTSSASA